MKIMTQDRERICEFGDAWVVTHGGGSSIVMWNGVYLGTYNEKKYLKQCWRLTKRIKRFFICQRSE